jgi:hypothetical protein
MRWLSSKIISKVQKFGEVVYVAETEGNKKDSQGS